MTTGELLDYLHGFRLRELTNWQMVREVCYNTIIPHIDTKERATFIREKFMPLYGDKSQEQIKFEQQKAFFKSLVRENG